MIEMASSARLTKVSRVFLRAYTYTPGVKEASASLFDGAIAEEKQWLC
jgi:hypothetical protein